MSDQLWARNKPREAAPQMSTTEEYQRGRKQLEKEQQDQERQQKERQRLRDEALRPLEQLDTPLDRLSRRLTEIEKQYADATITGDERKKLEGAARKDYFEYVDKETERRLKQGDAKAGPTTAVLKGSAEAFAAERERARLEDDRYREEVRREQVKLQVLSEIANNTKPENRQTVETVEV